jgi:tRNA(Ile)-lysidine synthase
MSLPLSDLASRVSETIAKHRMLETKDRILLGVSGGSDSVAFAMGPEELGYQLGVAHINHGLRAAESDEDERFTFELAAKLGLPYFSRRLEIRTENGNLEASARIARKQFFNSVCESQGFTKIAIAHTRDDRIETFLLHLLRGAGVKGMVSMSPIAGNTVRPLIDVSQDDIQHFLLALNSRGERMHRILIFHLPAIACDIR